MKRKDYALAFFGLVSMLSAGLAASFIAMFTAFKAQG